MSEIFAHESIDENLRFLILEVKRQLERTRQYVSTRSPKLLDSIFDRDDYVDNLKNIIQRKVLAYASRAKSENGAGVHILNSADVVTQNLERIADFCENIVNQLGYIESAAIVEKIDFSTFFSEVLGGLELVEKALFGRDVESAIAICRKEAVTDELYVRVRQALVDDLKRGAEPQSTVTAVFIAHYFERMGDALLNIGEAVLSASLGETVKIGHFQALQDSLEAVEMPLIGGVALQAIQGTRSGHRIARVSHRREGDAGRMVIFKEGRARKLREEVESIRKWEAIVEGLAPKVYSFLERGDTGAILFEYLPGNTFEQVLLGAERDDLEVALDRVFETLEIVWTKTLNPEPVAARFLEQLVNRTEDLYAVHPEFHDQGGNLGGVRIASLDELVREAAPLDEVLTAPFSVFVHGDFNVDNIIYDAAEDRIRFIDLHRSRQMDYVQDVSVFLVSNLRLRALKSPMRRRIHRAVARMLEFAKGFAARRGDSTFEARLGLGLSRSLATSTRFVLDANMSKGMMLKSRYLLERLVAVGVDGVQSYRIPEDVLYE